MNDAQPNFEIVEIPIIGLTPYMPSVIRAPLHSGCCVCIYVKPTLVALSLEELHAIEATNNPALRTTSR